MNNKIVLRCAAFFAVGTLLAAGAGAQTSGIIKVSDAIEGGQPGASAARCGTSVVVGFGDQETSPSNSFDGYAVSHNGGASFQDLGVLPADSSATLGNFQRLQSGSPSMGCFSTSLFYAASRYGFDDAGGQPFSAIALSTSADGGNSWALPVLASTVSADIYGLRMPSLAVDPTNAQQLYIAYVNLNTGGPDTPDCPFGSGILEFVYSTDGGKTWDGRADPSAPGRPDMQLDHACGFAQPFPISNPNVIVSPTGAVYIAYEYQGSPSGTAPHEIRFIRSLDHGKTFSAPVVVSTQAIYGSGLQLGVDRTNSPHRGQIYLTFSESPMGTFTSIMESDSLNGGTSFSFPRPVNGTPATGAQRFQADPVIAVDNDGQVQVCYYNTTSNTPSNSSVYSYNCAISSTHAATWQLRRVADSAVVGADATASDFLMHHDGFFTAFELQANGVAHVAGQFSDMD